jgi:uncharacterized protein
VVVIGSAGVLAPGKWRWLRALAWMAALCVATVALFNLVAKAALWLLTAAGGIAVSATSPAPAGVRLAAAVAGCVALIATYWGAVRLGEKRRVPELDLRHAPADLLIGLVLGAALMAAIVGTLWSCHWVTIEARPVDRIALALRDSIRSGVVEETVLRLVIFRLLWRSLGLWPALIGAALLFGALHLANPDASPFAALCLIAGEGIGIGLYLLTGRIWAAIGMHAAWNFTQGWIFGATVSGIAEIAGGPLSLRSMPDVADILSGGGFGPEASLAALTLSVIASAGLLLRAWKRDRFVAMDG